MTANAAAPSFLSLVMAEFGTFPRRGLVYLGAISTLAALFDLFTWMRRDDISPLGYGILAVLFICWFSACYASSMLLLNARTSIVGLGKLLVTSFMMTMPVLLAVALVIIGVRTSNPAIYAGGGFLIIVGFVALPLLQGWPIVQALSSRLIGPLQAFRATAGRRWNLVFAAFLVSALNRFLPSTSSTSEFATACVLAVAGIAVSMASAMAMVSIAVAAARLMTAKLEMA